MRLNLLLTSVLLFFVCTLIPAQNFKILKKGYWAANLTLNNTTKLPFRLEISGSKKKPNFIIHNAEEKIQLSSIKKINDSLQIDFPNFHSYLRFIIKGKTEISGTWTNLNKGNNYKIPFHAEFGNVNIPTEFSPLNLTGRWKTNFSPNSEDSEMAIGVFKSSEHKISGTFLTETGDYRFLDGYTFNNKMILSCFDGSHAFLFTADLKDEQLSGVFFSGKHYSTKWIATKDEKFQLRNPDSLTYLVKKESFNFKVKDLENKDFSFPNEQFNNKVTVVQIMGTWCPNCLDETRFLKEMYEKYHSKGLEIISVCYETPNDFAEQVQKVNLLKNRLDLDYTFLIGGTANKALASEQFSVLNQIISYPTAIFLNKKGEVVKIHTGFNGPGTGEIYSNFVKETEGMLLNLLQEKD
jgi:thiol-disulfide isomerase/thioredoxin